MNPSWFLNRFEGLDCRSWGRIERPIWVVGNYQPVPFRKGAAPLFGPHCERCTYKS